jgi:hypothetical protein
MGAVGLGTRAARSTRSKRPVKSTTGSVKQPAQKLDLLLLAGAAGAEVLPEGLVLDVAPPDSHAEPEPAARKELEIGRLPRHQRRLALREDHDAAREPDPLGDGGQVGEHHERIVERVVLGVRAGQPRRAIGMHGAEHVVVGEQVVEAQRLDRGSDAPNRARVSAKLDLWVDDADLHGSTPFQGLMSTN